MKRGICCLAAACLPLAPSVAADPRCSGDPVTYQKIGLLIDTPEKAQQLARFYLTSVSHLPRTLLLKAEARDDVWTVRATAPVQNATVQLDGGGEVQLCKTNGKVLRLVAGLTTASPPPIPVFRSVRPFADGRTATTGWKAPRPL
jgi:hypothetical protein